MQFKKMDLRVFFFLISDGVLCFPYISHYLILHTGRHIKNIKTLLRQCLKRNEMFTERCIYLITVRCSALFAHLF